MLTWQPGKKIYFVSDAHLGVPGKLSSREREKQLVRWLDEKKQDAAAFFLVGDLFDFWFEYRHVVPKGFVRLLGKLAEITDSGIPVHAFTGNHDMWMFGYFEQELGIPVHRKELEFTVNNRHFYVAHGDGLGPGDRGYKLIKSIFANRFCQVLFGALHPALGIGLANFLSGRSRAANHRNPQPVTNYEEELMVIHSREVLKQHHVDFFLYGHRHVPGTYRLSDRSLYVNLGDWISYFTYAEFDGEKLELKEWAVS